MSTVNAPFGLDPIWHPSGLVRPTAYISTGTNDLLIPSGTNVNIFKGQAVKLTIGSGGAINGVTVATGAIVLGPVTATGDAVLGVFAGVEYVDSTGKPWVSNYWPANTAYQTGSCIAYVWDDPLVVYEMQAAGSLTQAAIGEQFDITNDTAGSNVTGLSQCTLGTTAAGAGNSKQMRVVNLAPFPGNAWGDAYTVVQVQISEHQYVATIGAV